MIPLRPDGWAVRAWERGIFSTTNCMQLASSGLRMRQTEHLEGSAGGPNSGGIQTFWFSQTYEGQRFSTTLTNNSVVPTSIPSDNSLTAGTGTIRREYFQLLQNNVFQLALGCHDEGGWWHYFSAPHGRRSRRRTGPSILPSHLDTTGDNVSRAVDQ